MKLFSRQGLFPWFPLLTGMAGLALRFWLLSTINEQGLLPTNHIAGILTFLLLLVTLGICFWDIRTAAPSQAYRKLFPPSKIAAAGTAVGAAGMGISAFIVNAAGFLRILLPILGVLGAAALLYAAHCRRIGLRPSCLLHGGVTLFLVFRVLVCCRMWGAEPQLQLYFFQLLGSLFLLLACYFRAEADALIGDYRKYLFFGQAALFCCCLCLSGNDWLFYLSAGIWMATDYCVFPANRYETQDDDTV